MRRAAKVVSRDDEKSDGDKSVSDDDKKEELDFDGLGFLQDDDGEEESKGSVIESSGIDVDFNGLSRVLDGHRPHETAPVSGLWPESAAAALFLTGLVTIILASRNRQPLTRNEAGTSEMGRKKSRDGGRKRSEIGHCQVLAASSAFRTDACRPIISLPARRKKCCKRESVRRLQRVSVVLWSKGCLRRSTMNSCVLLVEDEVALRLFVGDSLRNEGYAVEYARDGCEGLEKATNLPIDLIILDVMLPRKNGFEVCQAIRAAGLPAPILMPYSLQPDRRYCRGIEDRRR